MGNKVVIVIVTYNGMQWLPKTLVSIPDKYHVVVVDNNSTDNTVDYIYQNFKNITLFQQKMNLGFGGGNNLGMRYALEQNVDYVFLLNQDAYLDANTIDNLIHVHQSNSNFGILSPIHLNGKGNELDWNFSTYLDANILEVVKKDLVNKGAVENKLFDVPFVNAAAWLLPISTINTIGGFDPIFFHYGEDNNYCQRVLYHKLKIGVVSNTYIKHDRFDKGLNPNISLEEALKKREKQLKVIWADITEDNLIDEASKRKKTLFRKLLSSLVKFNFKNVNYRWEEISLINKIVPEIKLSREINKEKGRHYLDE